MAFGATAVSVLITSTSLGTFQGGTPEYPNVVTIQNLDGTNPIYVQSGATATANGFRLAAGESFEVPIISAGTVQLSAIAVGGTVLTRVWSLL